MTIFDKSRVLNKFLNIVIKILDFIYSKYKLQIFYILRRNILTLRAQVIFVCEQTSWAVFWIGKNLTEKLKEMELINAEIASPLLAKNKIIHWGAINYLIKIGRSYLEKPNFNIINWYHVVPNDERLNFIPYLNKHVDLLITASPITKKNLVDSGFDEDKINIIPFGIDLSHFRRYDKKKQGYLKKKFNLTSNKIIIGSFQKDGEGWGDGMEPKFVKGPDIFCEVVKKLNDKYDIHVLLTGPARGYVKKKLKEFKVPYTHLILHDYMDIVECYNVLDLYIVSSRVEGGPQALLEAMATGVPLVTTNVGMAPYLIKDKINGFKTQIENVDDLYNYCVEVIKNEKLREKIVKNAFETVKEYNWESIAKQYYEKIYKKAFKTN
ncbi:MAG: glycosyltransferase family 4 protein [Candidatus Hodarchaeota archaeon]